MKNKNNIIDFKTNEAIYQVILPLDLAMRIPYDDSVRLLNKLVGEMDLGGVLKRKFVKSRIPFEIMLKLVIYGYMNGAYSSRAIETACRRDINFMWLLQGYPAPDHNTVARFRSSLDTEEIFTRLVKLLKSAKEIDFENVFIDGTKLEANANRYTFVWKGSIEKNSEKLKISKERFLKDIEIRYGIKFFSLQGVLDYFDLTEFVSGKGRRKSGKQRDYETAYALFQREQSYEKYLKKLKGRKSLSKTDNDATFMRLKEDHMKNGQLKPAYNMQIAVENEYVTGTYVSHDRDDVNTLKPMLEKLEGKYGGKYVNVTADSGYESEENYVYLAEKGYTGYIKPQNYETSKTRKYKKQIGRKENMAYDFGKNTFTCAEGRKLMYAGTKERKTATGYICNVRVYECQSCDNCPKRALCTKCKGNKKIEYSPVFDKYRKQSLANITTEKGVKLRINRSIQAEGAFGVLKEDYGFRRFLTRGKSKISTEFNLLCIAYDIRKLYGNIQNDRPGCKLYDVKRE